MQKVTPFLWFDGQAEEAAKFYVSIFKQNSKIKTVFRTGGGPGKKGPVLTVAFQLRGQNFVALNGGPHYKFTPAVSFFVDCKTQKEIDMFWKKLGSGGKPGRCGWLEDKFGVSWQIVPSNMSKLLSRPGAMQAMMTMDKLDIAQLKAAGAKKQ